MGGTYSLDGTDIVRTVGEQRVVAYSAAYLQEESNIRVRRLARTWVAHDEVTTEPYAIAYDPSSGNVIVAMGLQGVVVGTPNEEWTRVAVGHYLPTDFSIAGKLRDYELWLVGTALGLSIAALGLVFSEGVRGRDVLWTLAIIPLLICASFAAYFLPISGFYLIPLYVGALVMAVAFRSNPNRTGLGLVFAGLGVALSLIGLGGIGESSEGLEGVRMELGMGVVGIMSSFLVVVIYLKLRHALAFLLALVGMLALFGVAAVLWMANAISLGVVFLSSVGLMGVTTYVLRQHIRRSEVSRAPPKNASST